MKKEITRNYIEEFKKALQSGLDNIVKAAEIYVEAIDSDYEAKDKFSSSFDGTIPAAAWAGFEAVGRKAMHPKLLFGGGNNRGYIKRLIYSDQEDVLSGKRVSLLIDGGDSIMVDPREITKEQAQQLFDRDHIRTLSEQKAYVESQRLPQSSIEHTAEQLQVKVVNHKLYIKADTVLTKREVARLLESM